MLKLIQQPHSMTGDLSKGAFIEKPDAGLLRRIPVLNKEGKVVDNVDSDRPSEETIWTLPT